MNWEPFITCAVTGGGATAGIHPELPITPAQIADAAIDAAKAGAAVVHCHVRHPETGAPSRRRRALPRGRGADPVERRRCADQSDDRHGRRSGRRHGRAAADTPGPGSDFVGPDERIAHVRELLPDICTLDCGSMNFGDGDAIYVAPPTYLRAGAEKIRALGVKPELEVFDLGQLAFVNRMVQEGLIDDPPFIQVCLGIPWGAGADAATMMAFVQHLPPGCVWSGLRDQPDGDADAGAGDAARRQPPRRARGQPLPDAGRVRLERPAGRAGGRASSSVSAAAWQAPPTCASASGWFRRPPSERAPLDRPAGLRQPISTERGGFEPPMELAPHNGFRDRRLQPLGHLSLRPHPTDRRRAGTPPPAPSRPR